MADGGRSENGYLKKACRLLWLFGGFFNRQSTVKNLSLIEQIHSYILENIATPLSVDDICSQFFVNRQKLHSLFKKHFNDSVKHFILAKRLEKAKDLLLNSDKSVENIAYETGFSNYNYFIRVFRLSIGIPPFTI